MVSAVLQLIIWVTSMSVQSLLLTYIICKLDIINIIYYLKLYSQLMDLFIIYDG